MNFIQRKSVQSISATHNYISISHRACRKNRSTVDILWTYRFYMATIQKYEDEFSIMGMHLSKVFDHIRLLLPDTMQF